MQFTRRDFVLRPCASGRMTRSRTKQFPLCGSFPNGATPTLWLVHDLGNSISTTRSNIMHFNSQDSLFLCAVPGQWTRSGSMQYLTSWLVPLQRSSQSMTRVPHLGSSWLLTRSDLVQFPQFRLVHRERSSRIVTRPAICTLHIVTRADQCSSPTLTRSSTFEKFFGGKDSLLGSAVLGSGSFPSLHFTAP